MAGNAMNRKKLSNSNKLRGHLPNDKLLETVN